MKIYLLLLPSNKQYKFIFLDSSIDAKAKIIQVTVKAGGTKSVQIADNGTGILKENLPILCERFTTSKLQNFSDLQSIRTYGFRGEALASISLVSRLSIQTKTKDDPCAYKVRYESGNIIEGPIAVAGNQGTTITFDDIFYNNAIRLRTLKFPSEEFAKIYDVVSKYAVHNYQLSFCLKKFGESNSIKTCASSTPLDVIRIIYGANVANHLLDVSCDDDKLKFNMKALVSKADYSGKKRFFLLFINHRLVEAKSLKRAIFDEVYQALLPSNVQPFVYMSLEMDPMNLDVNVSPTKNEVNFLNEDAIVAKIKEAIEENLLSINETRNVYTQQLLPGASVVFEKSSEEKEKCYAKDMVRTDSKAQTLAKFFSADSSGSQTSQSPKAISTQVVRSPAIMNRSKSKKSVTSELSSIIELKGEVARSCDESLREQISNLNFVGISSRSKALIQCDNMLYICKIEPLCFELFYQRTLEKFENFDSIQFEHPLDISGLAMIGFGMKEIGWDESDGSKEFLARRVCLVLIERRELLREYYNIKISVKGELETLPSIIPSFLPVMAHLPVFIIRLACDVNYENEKECFNGICKELASFYSKLSLTSTDEEFLFLNETILFPEMKNMQPPSAFMKDGTLLKLTSLQELYKVFERC